MKLKLTLIAIGLFTFSLLSFGQTIVNDNYRVKSGNGNGIKFWSDTDYYKIHMGKTANGQFGPVTDYSIKMNMSNHTSRGWVWGPYNNKPVAALNTQGNFQINGWMKINTTRDASKTVGTGGLEIAGALRIDGNEMITNANKTLFLNYDNNGDVSMDHLTLRVDASSNRVGVGFSAPQSKLEVKGTVRATSSSTRSNRTEIGHTGSRGFVNTVGVGDLDFRHDGNTLMSLKSNGNVVIGNVTTPSADYKLYVQNGILAEKVRVAIKNSSDWADFVFEDSYSKLPIKEVSEFIEKNNHLPDVPSADEVVEKGINLGEMDAILLRKLEEAYLYIIDLDTRMNEMQNKLNTLNK